MPCDIEQLLEHDQAMTAQAGRIEGELYDLNAVGCLGDELDGCGHVRCEGTLAGFAGALPSPQSMSVASSV